MLDLGQKIAKKDMECINRGAGPELDISVEAAEEKQVSYACSCNCLCNGKLFSGSMNGTRMIYTA